MQSERLLQLRKLHSSIVYKSFDTRVDSDTLKITYHFHLIPNVDFYPTISIPLHGIHPDIPKLNSLVFATGLIEFLSYWKAACPRNIQIECGSLSLAQTAFLKKLFIKGMGEFYFVNKIDFTADDFITITSSGPAHPTVSLPDASGDCVLAAGGKDSSLLLELIKPTSPSLKALSVIGSPSTDTSVRIAGISENNHIRISRTIDKNLIELNGSGYLNGHTPFSALIAHLSILVGVLYKIKNFYVGNERSASEENTIYLGLPINHQYSKSFEFEKDFRAYAANSLTPDINYLSFLRPLYEIQIAKLFSAFPQHFKNFKSCNVNQKQNSWCLNCAKCLFVYLMMRPWITHTQSQEIFSGDPLSSPQASVLLNELLGLSPVKPLECIGTREESILGAHLTAERLQQEGQKIPASLSQATIVTKPHKNLLTEFASEHFLTTTQLESLKMALQD